MPKYRRQYRQKTTSNSRPINSYLIPPEVIKEMDDMNHDTHVNGREHGMSLCVEKGSNIIKVGHKSMGTESGISVPDTCRSKNDKYVGSFHTHPDDSEAAASAQDLFTSCLRFSNLDCVGKDRRGHIVCYAKKQKNSSCAKEVMPLKNIEDVFHEVPLEDLPAIKRELYREVDKAAEKRFNFHTIK